MSCLSYSNIKHTHCTRHLCCWWVLIVYSNACFEFTLVVPTNVLKVTRALFLHSVKCFRLKVHMWASSELEYAPFLSIHRSHTLQGHLISSYSISFHLVLSIFMLFHLVLSYSILFHLVLSHFMLFYLVLSYFILFHLVQSHFMLFHLVLSHFILFYLITSSLIFFYFIIIYLVTFTYRSHLVSFSYYLARSHFVFLLFCLFHIPTKQGLRFSQLPIL